jgi:DNA polymerase-3 subunit delta
MPWNRVKIRIVLFRRLELLYILTGEDDFSVTRALDELKKELGDKATLAISTTTLEGKEVTPQELKNVCETVPFLSGKRLVIIEGLLARFEPQNKPRRQSKTTRTEEQADRHKPFAACFENLPDSTVAVLVEGKISAGNPLFKELSGKATVKTFPLIKSQQLAQWVQTRMVAESSSISPKATGLLTRLIGSNLWNMASEIDKLALYAKDRRIEEEDVKTLVGFTQETSVFNLIDAIMEFRAEDTEQLLQRMLQDGAAPAYLLTMLARQIQLMVRAKEMKNRRIPNTEIQSKLSLTNDFAFRKTMEQSGKYSLPRLKEMYHRLLDTDISIKTGQYDAELALTILAAELSRPNNRVTLRT